MKAMRVLFAAALVGAAFALPACPITSIFDTSVDGGGTENYNGGRVAIIDVRGAETRANGMISCAKGVAFTYEKPAAAVTGTQQEAEENWTAAKTAALQSNPDLAGAVEELYPQLDKDTDLVQVYCQAGWAAEQAAYVLTQAGYGNVVILGGWASSTPPQGSSENYEFEDAGTNFATCKDSNGDYVPNITGEAWTAQSCSETFENATIRNGIKFFYNPNCGCTALLPAVGGNTAIDDPAYDTLEGQNLLIAQAVEVQTCPWNIGGVTYPTGILLDVRGKRPTGDNPPIISCATTAGNDDLGYGFGVKWKDVSPATCVDDSEVAVSNEPSEGWTETTCTDAAATNKFTAAVTTKGTVYIEKKADLARLQLESNGYTNVVLLGGWNASNGYDSVFPGGIGNSPLRECGCQAPKAAPECVQEPKKPEESSSRRLMEKVKDGLLGSPVLAGMAA